MALFRRRASPGSPSAGADHEGRSRRSDTEESLGALLEELGLVTQAIGDGGWELELDRQQAILVYSAEDADLGARLPLGKDVAGREETLDLLRANLEPQLPRFALGPDDDEWPLAAALRVPLDPFDRATVLLALEHLAVVAEIFGRAEPELQDRLRRERLPERGELAEQAAHDRSRDRVVAALDALAVPAAENHEKAGVWRLVPGGDVVEAVLRDTGESLMLMREVPVLDVLHDDALARYLLTLSDWTTARLGLGEAAGEPVLYAATVLPAAALTADHLAFGLDEVAALAEGYIAELAP